MACESGFQSTVAPRFSKSGQWALLKVKDTGEDALVPIEGVKGNVADGSTVAVSIITMAPVAETASELSRKGIKVEPFVSPNVPDVAPDHNEQVFERFSQLTKNIRK